MFRNINLLFTNVKNLTQDLPAEHISVIVQLEYWIPRFQADRKLKTLQLEYWIPRFQADRKSEIVPLEYLIRHFRVDRKLKTLQLEYQIQHFRADRGLEAVPLSVLTYLRLDLILVLSRRIHHQFLCLTRDHPMKTRDLTF